MALRPARTRRGRFRQVLRSAAALKKKRAGGPEPPTKSLFQVRKQVASEESNAGARTDDEEEAMLQDYEQWLRGHGVWWDQDIRLRPPVRTAAPGAMEAGWGLRALKPIEKGRVLIRVPRSAVVSAANVSVRPNGEAPGSLAPQSVQSLLEEKGILQVGRKFDPDIDTQLPQALALILARQQASWQAKLRPEVTPTSCDLPWALPGPLPRFLKGTDVEGPVMVKRARLRQEFQSVVNFPELAGVSEEEYVNSCAVILSRVQPWYSGCLVPFVDHINHKWGLPDVEFLRKGDTIIGTSLGKIEVGEVYQSYGNISTADSVYRYGFAPLAATSRNISPLPGDCITISIADLKKASRCCGVTLTGEALLARCRLLSIAEAVEESPWDGSSELGIELAYDKDAGLAALLVAATVLVAPAADLPDQIGSVPTEEKAASTLVYDFLMERARRRDTTGKLLELFQASKKKRRRKSDSWMDNLPPPTHWAGPESAIKLALNAISERGLQYEGCEKTVAEDEVDFDHFQSLADDDAAKPRAIERALLQLRILERRLLASTSEAIRAMFPATA